MLLHHVDVLIGVAVVLGSLSLLVTLLVQAVIAVLALRGSNLRWGLETLLTSVSPLAPAAARATVDHVLRHPLLSGSVLATRPGNGAWLAPRLRRVGLGGLQERWALAKAIRVEELVPVLRELADPAGQPWQQALAAALHAQADALVRVRVWFDRTMDRVSERFTTRTRSIAVVASFALACTLHVDVLHIYGAVSGDPALRAELVQVAKEMGRNDVAGAEAQLVRSALESVAAAHQLGPVAVPISSLAAAEQWLAERSPGAERRQQATDALLRQIAELRLARLREHVAGLTSGPVWDALDFWPLRAGHGWWDWWNGPQPLRHALGVLFGGALLSLGAPFWFNLLKTLMTLRPALAEKADRERAARG